MKKSQPVRSLLKCAAFVLILIGIPIAAQGAAEEAAVEVSGGSVSFTEETEGFGGAGFRLYVSPRISVGPEITHIRGERHSHWIATGNLTFDFIRQDTGRRLIPFGVAGGGIFHTREEFFQSGTSSSTEGAFTAGAGARVLLGRRVTIGGDVRVGWELHVRAAAILGFRLF